MRFQKRVGTFWFGWEAAGHSVPAQCRVGLREVGRAAPGCAPLGLGVQWADVRHNR